MLVSFKIRFLYPTTSKATMNISSDLTKNDAILKIDSTELDDARLPSTKSHVIEIENKSDSQVKRSEINKAADESSTKISPDAKSTWFLRVGSAAFYAVASMMIMVINKRILTVYAFPSFQVLGLGQMTATILLLWIARSLSIVNFPSFSRSTLTKIWPLPLYYAGNMIFGLAGTQALSLPMMVAIRRSTVLMTMIAEYIILKVKPGLNVQIAVLIMILGGFVAAISDLAFSLLGYSYILMNNICSTMNVVTIKQKLNAKDLGKYGLLFYNSLLMLPITVLLSYITGDLAKAYEFDGWTYKDTNEDDSVYEDEDYEQSFDIRNVNVAFLLHFLLSCVFGFILIFATLLCTLYNSALTTMIIGSLKNTLITYLGMFIGGDYVFAWWNFIGLTMSTSGSLYYAWVTFGRKANNENNMNKANRLSSDTSQQKE